MGEAARKLFQSPDRTVQLYPADDIPERGRDDSLIAALIEKLPPPGSSWSQVERQAWLAMMETAFNLLYGGPAGGGMTKAAPRAIVRTRPAPARKPAPSRSKATGGKKKPKPVTLAPLEPDFFIDKQGIARRAGGERIMPGDVGDVLVDQRGEHGDLGAITWADDSRGTKGHSLDIQAG